jgi:hypothetical protein
VSTVYRLRRPGEERPYEKAGPLAPAHPQEPAAASFEEFDDDSTGSTEVTRLHEEMRKKLRDTDSRLTSLSEKIEELLALAAPTPHRST